MSAWVIWVERVQKAYDAWHHWHWLPGHFRMDRVLKQAGVRDLIVEVEQLREALEQSEAVERQLREALNRSATPYGWAHPDDGSACMEPAWCNRDHYRTPMEARS